MQPADPKHALYAGSFDPPTNGHLSIIKQAAGIFTTLTIGIGTNPSKQPFFNAAERLALLNALIAENALHNTRAADYTGQYLVDYALQLGCGTIIRGIRSASDLEFEMTLKLQNERRAADLGQKPLETIFMLASRDHLEISSSAVKGMIGYKGWQAAIKPYVPNAIHTAITEKIG